MSAKHLTQPNTQQTPVLQPGFFDGRTDVGVRIGDVPGAENLPQVDLPQFGQAPEPLEITIRPEAPDQVPQPQEEIQVAGMGKVINGILDARKILKEHEAAGTLDELERIGPKKRAKGVDEDANLTEGDADPLDAVAPVEGRKTAVEVSVDAARNAEVMSEYQRYVEGTPYNPSVDFNANNINSEEDVLQMIAAQSEVYAKEIDDETGGVIAHTVTREMANLVGTDQARLMKKLLGGDILAGKRPGEVAANMLAARDLLVASEQEAVRLAKLVQDANTEDLAAAGFETFEDAALAMERQFSLNAQIHQKVKGAQTEIARALSSFNIASQGDALRQQNIRDVLEGAGNINPRDRAAFYLAIEDPASRAKYMRDSMGAKTFDALYEAWINALLSSSLTHMVNVLGNLAFAFGQVPTRTMAAMMGHVRRQRTGANDGVFAGEDAALAMGMILSSLDALKLAGKAFKDPQGDVVAKLEPGKKFKPNAFTAEAFGQSGWFGQGIDLAGQVFTMGRLSTRLLAAEDTYFKVMAQRASIYADAVRQSAIDGTQDAGTLANNIAHDIANPLVKDQQAARDFGQYVTFQNKLGDAGRNLQGAIANSPLVRWFIPFFKTPMNIISRAWEHTPFEMASRRYKQAVAAGGEQADMARARVALGTMTMTGVAALAQAGYITGGGPSDPRLRKNLERQGWQPYSLRIGDTYVSYKRIEPFATVMGLTADLAEIMWKGESHPNVQEAVASLGMAFSKNVTSKTWMTGMASLIDAIENPDRYGPRVVENFVRSVIPRGIAQMERISDPERRYVRDLVDAIRQDVPGWSDNLPADLNLWGEPIVYQAGGIVSGMLNPFYLSDFKESPVDAELHGLQIGLPPVAETIPNTGGAYLFDPWEYHDYKQRAGTIAKASLEDLIKTPAYKNSNDLVKEARIRAMWDASKSRAWAWMLYESNHSRTMQGIIKQVGQQKYEELSQ